MKRLDLRVALFLGLSVLTAAAVMLFVAPIPQPLSYHNFADQRCLLCVPHMLNVVSNLPFVLIGLWGVAYVARTRRLEGFQEPLDRWLYGVFFAAIALTGIGSAYYHSEPNNGRLLWDRLPLAVGFMALFALIIKERVDRRVGLWIFLPLAMLGGGSVVYWNASEVWGRGDLRLYFLVQFYPLLAVPLILLCFPARFTRSADLYGALAWYGLAKVLELLDRQIFALSQDQIVSGHTLKHLAAAVSAYLILHMIQRRRPLEMAVPRLA